MFQLIAKDKNAFKYLKPVEHWIYDKTKIYINNSPTRCNAKQSIYYPATSLYMFRVSTIFRST